MKKRFVDLQVNGYLGVDFSSSDLTMEKIYSLTKTLVKSGIIAYCPTIISSPEGIYKRNLALISRAMEEPALKPHILGIHLEGPFISRETGFRGAHNKRHILLPEIKKYEEFQVLAKGKIVILTLAPELPKAMELIKHITKNSSTVVSLGHHNADAQTIKKACDAGAKCVTHLGNGIPNFLPRHNNPVWPQLAQERLMAAFITDGFHLPQDFIKVALKAKTVERFIVVSDSSPVAGLPPGKYTFTGQEVIIHKNGKITSIKGDCLAGSNCNMAECMKRIASLGLLDEQGLRKIGYLNPLKLLKKGT